MNDLLVDFLNLFTDEQLTQMLSLISATSQSD
jgi:hypothetical protein